MKRIFALLCMLPFLVAAQTIDMSTLSNEQRQQISKVLAVEKPAAVAVREEAEAWTDLGAKIGSAMIGAAKQIGVAANDFANTDLGKIVTFIIVYKLIGESLIGVLIGIGVVLIGWTIGLWMVFRKRYKSIEYAHVPVLFGLVTRKVVSTCTPDHSDDGGWTFTGCVVIAIFTGLGCAIAFV